MPDLNTEPLQTALTNWQRIMLRPRKNYSSKKQLKLQSQKPVIEALTWRMTMSFLLLINQPAKRLPVTAILALMNLLKIKN